MASKHARRGSGRALQRRTTRGPLDDDDPLSSTASSMHSPLRSHVISPIATPPVLPESDSQIPAQESLADSTKESPSRLQLDKDLSFLLDPSIYHPLSQLEVAAPFRRPFPQLPSSDVPLSQSFAQLDILISKCDFLAAAYLAGGMLTSGAVKSNDIEAVFSLIHIRFSCLELTGNGLLAAQESKALEDLTSSFYYFEPTTVADESFKTMPDQPRLEHIMPFALRLQALRFQSIGFSDPRRGVAALFDLGLECRHHITSPSASAADRDLWATRLDEVGVRIVNALIEMGDLDCARRTLKSMKPISSRSMDLWLYRIVLLHIKIGDLLGASRLIKTAGGTPQEYSDILGPLSAIAEGRLDDAIKIWEQSPHLRSDGDMTALIKQNLAVACLYSGQVQKSKDILQDLVDSGHHFQSLTINLATIYELSSDKSKDLKISMADKIAKTQAAEGISLTKANVDFKL